MPGQRNGHLTTAAVSLDLQSGAAQLKGKYSESDRDQEHPMMAITLVLFIPAAIIINMALIHILLCVSIHSLALFPN